jgi:hypothetical protein
MVLKTGISNGTDMKKESIKKRLVEKVAHMQAAGNNKKRAVVQSIQKYVYTEEDLGEGLLYFGLSKAAVFASR